MRRDLGEVENGELEAVELLLKEVKWTFAKQNTFIS